MLRKHPLHTRQSFKVNLSMKKLYSVINFIPFIIFYKYICSTPTYAEEFIVGANSEYTSINAALAVAQAGDLVLIHAGRYEETIETRN